MIALGLESFKHYVSEGRERILQREASIKIGFGVPFQREPRRALKSSLKVRFEPTFLYGSFC